MTFEPWCQIWKSWTPGKCKFFIWLVVLDNRSPCLRRIGLFFWTTDRLARGGLSHPKRCHLCDQKEETVQHLLTGCLFTRQVWFSILSPLVWEVQLLDTMIYVFVVWWAKVFCMISKEYRKGTNSLIILTVWLLWKHPNTHVFNGDSPLLASFLDNLGMTICSGA